MSPIAETAAANGITALAKLVIEKLHHKYAMPLRMRRALRKGGENSPEDTLVSALQHAFGTHGTLTHNVNRSLLDIANAGLLEHIIPIFGADINRRAVLDLISYIYLSRGPENTTESANFATDLIACLQVAFNAYRSTVLDTSSPKERRRLRQSLSDDAKRASGVLSELVSSLTDENGDWLPDQDINPQVLSKRIQSHVDPLSQYVRSTISRLGSVDVHGSAGDVVKVSLDDIYVDIPVNFIPRRRHFE